MPTAETITLSWSPDAKATSDGLAALAPEPLPDLVIPARLGSVRLIRELGKGGMGVVWLGHHEFLDRQVAVKFLLATVTDRDDPRFQAFLDGARAAAGVRHLGLTAVLHADIVGHVPYLVMEYIQGPTVGDIVDRAGPLRLAAALAVLDRVADALDQLHQAGVIHRDVKPSNILIDAQGQAYLTDFGLCCRAERRSPAATSGTPTYMAAEAFEGEVSPRTDIYALATTVYHLLAGRAPYSGTVAELRRQHRQSLLPAAPLVSCAVPASVADILQRATHADPAFRTKSARKFLEGFREAAGKAVTVAEGVDQLARLADADPARRAPPLTTPAPSHSAVLTEPIPCINCGYELRGLPPLHAAPNASTPSSEASTPAASSSPTPRGSAVSTATSG